MTHSNNTVIGIDVGGPRKGFHAVMLREGQICGTKTDCDPHAMVEWCLEQEASVVGVDAPCMWSVAGKHREAERLLNQAGMHCFYTPTRDRAEGNPFYSWMLNGEKLFQALLAHFSLYTGHRNAEPVCFETFPHAIVCALRDEIVPAHPKKSVRCDVLRSRDLDISSLTNIDLVDAALCAVAADAFRRGDVKLYGDAEEGYVVVPRGKKAKREKGQAKN